MRLFLYVLILTLNVQISTKADDIKEFEIEGVSIGDSMLQHFTKDEIKSNNLTADFKDQSIQGLLFQDIDFIINYDAMQFVYFVRNMEIINITALTRTGEDINTCEKKKDKVVLDLSEMFLDTERNEDERNHPADVSGKSKVTSTYFYFKNDDFVAVECEQSAKSMGHPNVLKVSLRTKVYNSILRKEYDE